MRRRIPCRMIRGWNATRRIASNSPSIGQLNIHWHDSLKLESIRPGVISNAHPFSRAKQTGTSGSFLPVCTKQQSRLRYSHSLMSTQATSTTVVRSEHECTGGALCSEYPPCAHLNASTSNRGSVRAVTARAAQRPQPKVRPVAASGNGLLRQSGISYGRPPPASAAACPDYKCYSALEVQPCGTGLSVYSEPDN